MTPPALFTLLMFAAFSSPDSGVPIYTYDSFLKCEAIRQGMAASATFGNPQVEFVCKQNGLVEGEPDAAP